MGESGNPLSTKAEGRLSTPPFRTNISALQTHLHTRYYLYGGCGGRFDPPPQRRGRYVKKKYEFVFDRQPIFGEAFPASPKGETVRLSCFIFVYGYFFLYFTIPSGRLTFSPTLGVEPPAGSMGRYLPRVQYAPLTTVKNRYCSDTSLMCI